MNKSLQKILITLTSVLIRNLLRSNSSLRGIAVALLIVLAGVWTYSQFFSNRLTQNQNSSDTQQHEDVEDIGNFEVAELHKKQRSGVMVHVRGNVTRILADDNKGSRHQRFIISTSEGLSLLITHNIDLAPRVPININDRIALYGQYEWNHKGGLIHWTHHDPNKIHRGGWIEHDKVKYE